VKISGREDLRANISDELKDRTKRQKYMRKLVTEGQAKIVTASKIMEVVGNVAQSILSVKPTVDAVIQNVPQAASAALPWAGVCLGLKVSNNPHLSGFRIS
jgi:hypothetical protein